MSLAATLAADGMRPASFLPTIKCSSCSEDIEISAMGSHVCANKALPPAPAPSPSPPQSTHSSMSSLNNPFTIRQMNANAPSQPSPLQFSSNDAPRTRVRAPTLGSSQGPHAKASRTALPQVNTDVANKPFLAPFAQSETPISPVSSVRSGSSIGSKPPPPLRSMTSPMPRILDQRPPSPELSANLDCAFPPFPPPVPTTGSRPSTSSGRRTPNSDRSSSRTGSRPDLYNLEPKSPVSNGGENVISRMNTLKSGPFDPSQRRPSNEDRSLRERKSMDRRPSLPSAPRPEQFVPPLPSVPQSAEKTDSAIETPSTASSSLAQAFPERKQSMKRPPERPARPADSLTPSLINQLSAEPIPGSTSSHPPAPVRSRTLPAPSNDTEEAVEFPALSKQTSEPALRPSTDSTDTAQSDSLHLPPRSASKNENRIDYRMHDAPPVPKPVQLHRSDSRHRTSESESSTTSSIPSIGNSHSSTGQSPIGSIASSVDAFSPSTYDAGRLSEDKDMRPAGLNVKSQQKPAQRAEQTEKKSPPRTLARLSPPKDIVLPAEPTPPTPGSSSWPLESPMDPVMQNQRVGNAPESPVKLKPNSYTPAQSKPSSDDYDPYRAITPQVSSENLRVPPLSRSKTEADIQPIENQRPRSPFRSKTDPEPHFGAIDGNTITRTESPQSIDAALPLGQGPPNGRQQIPRKPPPEPQNDARPPLARQPTSGGKAKCRGCGIQIEGKSVKAADGRLTGRWHKACFVCKTCQQPFTTADFYVINNHPYCEQHYHEKNGSVCNSCHKGIEGQYLETTSGGPQGRVAKKYHRRCFTCVDCRVVLSDDYFEIAGRVYCERHALAAMRGQSRPMGPPGSSGLAPHGGSSLKAERRRTKLMNM